MHRHRCRHNGAGPDPSNVRRANTERNDRSGGNAVRGPTKRERSLRRRNRRPRRAAIERKFDRVGAGDVAAKYQRSGPTQCHIRRLRGTRPNNLCRGCERVNNPGDTHRNRRNRRAVRIETGSRSRSQSEVVGRTIGQPVQGERSRQRINVVLCQRGRSRAPRGAVFELVTGDDRTTIRQRCSPIQRDRSV